MAHQSQTDNDYNKTKSLTKRFIHALNLDIKSAKHATETNHQALDPAISLLENLELYPHLNLAQIIRGILNATLMFDNFKYKFLNEGVIGRENYKKYSDNEKQWLGDYPEQISRIDRTDRVLCDQAKFKVIERASKGPLFMVIKCAPNTLALYFECLKYTDSSIAAPELRPLLADQQHLRALKIFDQEINVFKEDEILLDEELKNLSKKIDQLKVTETNENRLKAARTLEVALKDAVNVYKQDDKSTPEQAKKSLITACTQAIKQAKLELDKEIDWGDFLKNLMISIVNAFCSTANRVFQSNFSLFKHEKACGVLEVEAIEGEITSWSKPN